MSTFASPTARCSAVVRQIKASYTVRHADDDREIVVTEVVLTTQACGALKAYATKESHHAILQQAFECGQSLWVQLNNLRCLHGHIYLDSVAFL